MYLLKGASLLIGCQACVNLLFEGIAVVFLMFALAEILVKRKNHQFSRS